MFHRSYGMPFLHGTIPDPRPQLMRYPAYFPDSSAAQQKEVDKLCKFLKARIKSMTGADWSQRHLSRVEKTSEFRTLHRCAVIPGIPALGESVMRWLFDGRERQGPGDAAMREIIRTVIRKAECEQLKMLERIVTERTANGDHGLVLTLAPSNAAVAAEWLRYRLQDTCHIIEVTAKNPKPAQRAKFIADVALTAETEPRKGVVVVSTYKLLSTGIDGLQCFINYLVKLGEPWTSKETEQAEGRIHRSGQKKMSIVYSIHGAKGSIDWELVQKNKRNLHLLDVGGSSILGAFCHDPKVKVGVQELVAAEHFMEDVDGEI